jgi:superfamily I DNA and/or RNA helicase
MCSTGEENKIIIVSLVRSNPSNIPGFIKIANRINVLLSRAKHAMYLIGNSITLTGQDGMWRDVVGIIQEHNSIGPTLQICCQN